MQPEDRVRWWHEAWQRRRAGCLAEIARLRPVLTGEAVEVLDAAQRFAAVDDLAALAAADVEQLVERVNVLADPAPVLMHRPVCNGVTWLRIAAQEVLAARADASRPGFRGMDAGPPVAAWPAGFRWLVVVSEDAEVRGLVAECAREMRGPTPTPAGTLQEAFDVLRPLHEGVALVVVNLTLASATGPGPHGLRVAAEARRRHHAVLLVTAAGDYHHYRSRLPAALLTGHDVIVKTRHDFADRLRGRIREVARPAPVPVSYEEDTGHIVWIGDVEVVDLEAQETFVFRHLDRQWRTPADIAADCWDSDLQPTPGSVPPLISTLRRKLTAALVGADSEHAQREVVESRRRQGMPSQYRLAPWLAWSDAPEPAGAPRGVPPVLLIEDDPDWAEWVVTCLRELQWPVDLARTAEDARQKLGVGETPILVVDLALPHPATGLPDHLVGIGLIEEVARDHPNVRMIVLSACGDRDSMYRRLFEAGVRTSDILRKTADREEGRAVLMALLQRAADEMWRGVRRPSEVHAPHRVKRVELTRIEVDGHEVRLSPREAAVLGELILRPNVPVKADVLEDRCYPRSGTKNKLHQTVKRLRQKIDLRVGRAGVGASVLRTPHRGARTTYELHGLVTDLAYGGIV